jgi:integrase
LTLGELFERFIADYASVHKRTWEQDVAQWARYVGGIKNRALSSITRYDVATLHARLGKEHGHTTANRFLSLLSKVFSYAAELNLPVANPVRGVRRFKEKSRERFLNADELARFFPAVDAEEPPWPDYFRLLLLTGVRKGNLESAEWVEFDLAAAVWTIPGEKSKNGRPLTLPLTPEAVQILQRRKAESNGSRFVFPTRRGARDGHVRNSKDQWKRICQRAGLVGVRVHDLRRTLGSWQAAAGSSILAIGRSLGHSSPTATAVYARLDLSAVRESVQKATTAMLAAAQVEGGEA